MPRNRPGPSRTPGSPSGSPGCGDPWTQSGSPGCGDPWTQSGSPGYGDPWTQSGSPGYNDGQPPSSYQDSQWGSYTSPPPRTPPPGNFRKTPSTGSKILSWVVCAFVIAIISSVVIPILAPNSRKATPPPAQTSSTFELPSPSPIMGKANTTLSPTDTPESSPSDSYPPPSPTASDPGPVPTAATPEPMPAASDPPPAESVRVYTDGRVPDYHQTNPQWETLRYEWNRQDNLGTMWIEVSVDAQMYAYYRNLERYQGFENYYHYILDENNRTLVRGIVSTIQEVSDQLSYSDTAVVREVAKFVQDVIEYQYDSDTAGEDEYPRYPIETLYERQGDCEDTSILMAAMLKELGYEVGFLHLPEHIAVALRTSDNYEGGSYYEINGHRYLFIESTGSGWNIGDIPEQFQQTEAEFSLIP